MIQLIDVTKKYGSLVAVDTVSFSVSPGEYFALLGPNGAGKTTIVRMLLDFSRPTSGQLFVNGKPSADPVSRTAIGYVGESHRVPPYLSGWQYLQRCAELLGLHEPLDECGRILHLVGMEGREHAKAGTYSRGMTQRIALGAALLGSPRLLVLDEPVSGLDPIGIRDIRLLLESLKTQGMTLLLSSHLLSEVEKICDSAAIIDRGKLLVKDRIATIVGEDETLEDVFIRSVGR
jgi:ABC-2 type transport system ATP-binding protein